jgi:hypothetical protein
MSITVVLFGVRIRITGQRYNVPVLRCRTPFEYAGQTPYMNDKCTSWVRALPWAQLVFIDLYGEIRKPRVPICPVLLLLSARVSPACRYVGLIICSHTRSIHFLSYLVSVKPGISIFSLLKYKLKESALVNVNGTEVLSKSIHLGVN